ncbi:MAG: tetratricopeptide repeat protein, partial [Arenimonas sp.]
MTAGQRHERLWERAERHLAQRNPEAARASLEALVASEPGHVMARLRLSTLATAAGRYRDSLEHLLAVAQLQPDDPELALMLAGMLHRLGEVAVALALLSNPAAVAAADRDTLEQMAQLAQQMDAAALAVRLLDRADAAGTPTVASLYLRATLQTFAGDIGAAQATLSECVARAP